MVVVLMVLVCTVYIDLLDIVIAHVLLVVHKHREQVDGLFETLLLCTTNESLSVVATTTLRCACVVGFVYV